MTTFVHAKQVSEDQLARLCRTAAAAMPALIISYTAIVDPLVNYDLAQGTQFGGVEIGGESKSRALTKIAMPAFLSLSVTFACFARPIASNRLLALLLPGAAFLGLACSSALWARSASTTLTLAIYQVILFASLALSVAAANNPRLVLRNMIAMFALVVLANLAALGLRPPTPEGHPGIYDHKNSLGSAAGCALLFGLFGLFERGFLLKSAALLTVFGAVLLTIASGSKTAIAMVGAAPFIAVAIYASYRFFALGALTAIILLSALVFCAFHFTSAIFGFDMDDVLLATYGDTTFTGRTGIWSFAAIYIEQAPILGNGYRGFWSLGLASPKHGSEVEFIRTIGSGHSGFVDTALDLGMIGVGLLITYILMATHFAGRFTLRPLHRSLLYLSVILFIIGRNTMESVILWSTMFDNLSFLLVGFLACYRDLPHPARYRSALRYRT